MAFTTTGKSLTTSSQASTARKVQPAFVEHEEELTWLAGFLTNDEKIARACMVDAWSSTEGHCKTSSECIYDRLRDAAIASALNFQRLRIAQLSSLYDRRDCRSGEYRPLSRDMMELVVMESQAIRLRLDTFCRSVLLLFGFQLRSINEIATLLGISEHAVEAAYSTAMNLLDVLRCEGILEFFNGAQSN